MGETFLFNFAAKVLMSLSLLALQEVSLARDVKKELEKLKGTLSTIQAVLLDAEDKQEKDCQLTDWLGKLQDAFYDAENVLDEFQYEDLRNPGVNRESASRKVHNFFSSSNILAFQSKMGRKIKKINKTFDKIAADRTKFNLTVRVEDRRVMPRERGVTHSFVVPSEVIGRDDDKEKIVGFLKETVGGENVSILPIVGIGGLGKTTLAKLVHMCTNDVGVCSHFDLKMWVCVSDVFDVPNLIKEILKSTRSETEKNESCDASTFDQLQTELRTTLANKRFLLTLDDVWNEDQNKWKQLRDLLLGGAKGSKIIVTTRSQLVASIMGNVPALDLGGLSHEKCVSLFVKWAFKEGEERHYPNLLKIGDEIVKKCKGVPLAVTTLGGLLHLKTDENDWLRVRDSELWELEQKEGSILPALLLSYNQLPSYLNNALPSIRFSQRILNVRIYI